MTRPIALSLLVAGLVFAAPVVHAQPTKVEAARVIEARARDAFRDKRYADAARDFHAAFQIDPNPNTKYNEGLAWGKAGKDAPEADALAEALSYGGLEAAITQTATQRLQQLKIKLGQVVVTKPVGAKVTVDHASGRSVPASVHLFPGVHELQLEHRNGSLAKRKVTVVAGEETQVAFVAPDLRQPPSVPMLPQAGDNDSGLDGLQVAGWSCLGLGGAAAIASGVVGGLTLSTVSAYDDSGNTDVELYDEAVTLKTTTNVLVGTGAGFAVVGAVLLLVDAVSGDSDSVSATPNGFLLRF